MALKPPWSRGKRKHEEIEKDLDREAQRAEVLARRLRRLQLELGLMDPDRRNP